MRPTTAAAITRAEHDVAVLLEAHANQDPARLAADIITQLMREGWRPTAARPPLPIPAWTGPGSPETARRGAEHARQLLATRTRR